MDHKIVGAPIAGLMFDLAMGADSSGQILPEGWTTADPLLQLADRFSVGLAAPAVGSAAASASGTPAMLRSIFDLVEIEVEGQVLKAPESHFLPPRRLGAGAFLPGQAAGDPARLTRALVAGLDRLAQAVGDLDLRVERCLALMQQYGWCLPAPTHPDLPAISLYDHSRVTAALAACLAETPGEQVEQWLAGQDLDRPVCALVGGDISGIQDFIYTITSKGAASALRGRSLYLQYLTDAVARFVLRRLALTLANLVFAGGGHFFILARAGDEKKIHAIQQEVSQILLAAHGGDLYLALAGVSLAANTLGGKALSAGWSQLSQALRAGKLRKFSELEDDLHRLVFAPRRDQGNRELECSVCGREDRGTTGESQRKKCPQCRDFESLGKDLRRARFLGVARVEEKALPAGRSPQKVADILAALGARYTLFDSLAEVQQQPAAPAAVYYALDDAGLDEGQGAGQVSGRKFLVNVTPLIDDPTELEALRAAGVEDLPGDAEVREGGAVKPFSALEQHAGPPFKRLGILRMDVDGMGKIMSDGLGERANLARLATLSFMINLYFEGVSADLARAYNRGGGKNEDCLDRIYSVYSGGDDLFFAGAWDVMPRLALDIRDHLAEFTGGHPGIHLSGGIALVKGKYPLYQAAEDGETALEAAKARPGKNSLTFLGQSLGWDKFTSVLKEKDRLVELVTAGELPRQVLQRLMGFQLQYEEKKKEVLSRGEELNKAGQEQILWGPWNWRSAYYLRRLKPKSEQAKNYAQKLAEKLEQEQFGQIEWIGFAARWADLETRND